MYSDVYVECHGQCMYADRVIRTPMDRFLFRRGCSTCVSLTTAAALISIVCLVWSSVEFVTAEKFIERFFPNKDEKYNIAYAAYMVIVAGLLIASFCLIFGIILDRYRLVTGFVWYSFLFNIIHVMIYVASVVMMIRNDSNFTNKLIFRIVVAFVWNFLFCYYLMLVNSYRLTTFLVHGH